MDESSVYRSVPQTLPSVPPAGKTKVNCWPFLPRSWVADVFQSPWTSAQTVMPANRQTNTTSVTRANRIMVTSFVAKES